MGCGGSKVDDLPLVVRCRERKDLIKSASDYRYALAAAHVSYFHSLKHVGDAIHRFVDEELIVNAVASTSSPDSPVLTLPSREGKSKSKRHHLSPSTSSSISHSVDSHDNSRHSHGHSGKSRKKDEREDSHLDLPISGSDSDSDSGHMHFHDYEQEVKEEEVSKRNETDIPFTSYGYNNGYNGYYYPPPRENWGYSYNPEENPNSYPYPFPYPFNYVNSNSNPNPNMYYMRKSATPAKTVVYDDPSVTGYFGYFGSPPQRSMSPEKPAPPPAPPSPPRVSTWDFFNVFDTYDSGSNAYPNYYPNGRYGFGYGSNTSSPDSKEVREREGIPDLEDETEQEVIKEVYKEKRKMVEEVTSNGRNKLSGENHDLKRNFGEGTSKSAVPPVSSSSDSISVESIKGKGVKSRVSPDVYHSPDSIVSKSTEEEVTKRKAVSFEVEDESAIPMDIDSSKPSTVTTLSAHGTRDLEDVVKEIKDEFETATSYGKEVALMLEVDKLHYQKRSTGLKVIVSRIMYMVSSHPPPRSSLQIPSTVIKMAKAYTGDVRTGFDFEFTNISVTLDKLYAWEKKLYREVKEEERLRVMYEERCKKLRILDDRGAEPSKIEATQASIRKLLTKINVSIRTISVISSKIHRIRDEELQPQIADLFKGLIRMWRSMLRCHQKQFQAIMESKVQSLKANTGLRRDSGVKATVELEMELINWCTRFDNWISSQKLYIESLNEWLMRCLDDKPEETADGIAPFSPGRLGAPPIFVICNDWYQAMVRISEKDVENAMLGFASNLHQLWERQSEEQHQRMKAEYVTKDFEKQLRAMRMERGRRKEQKQDSASDKTRSKESGVSPLDDLKVDLDSLKKKLQEERARHKEAAKLVHDTASSSIQGGLVPIFEALGNFTSEVVKAHEQVRLQSTGTS